MKPFAWNWKRTGQTCGTALAMAMLAGCAGVSPIESRKEHRADAYAALTPQFQSLVNSGQICEGMNADAVYIAWGPPDETKRGESSEGPTETWRYFGGHAQSIQST